MHKPNACTQNPTSIQTYISTHPHVNPSVNVGSTHAYVTPSANLGMDPGASEKAEDEEGAWSAEPVDYDLQVRACEWLHKGMRYYILFYCYVIIIIWAWF